MEQNIALRRGLQSATAFVQGEQANQALGGVTLTDMLEAQISAIEGDASPIRPGKINRIKSIRDQITATVAIARSLPPEVFVDPIPDEDVNTPE
jgi:hypothetical protein